MKRSYLAIGLILFVLLVDQLLKIWIKLNMRLGESFNVFGDGQTWFQIYFTENPGMAFGLEFGGSLGKLALSLFRIIAVGFITYYLYILVKQKKSYGLIASIALIWAGAVGNILDSIFFGLFFTESTVHSVATVTSMGQGYAGVLYGKVVDMLYFPLIEGHYPKWFPVVGGQHFQFFQPIFNIADSSISIGVALVIIFYRQFFKDLSKDDKTKPGGAGASTTEETTNEAGGELSTTDSSSEEGNNELFATTSDTDIKEIPIDDDVKEK